MVLWAFGRGAEPSTATGMRCESIQWGCPDAFQNARNDCVLIVREIAGSEWTAETRTGCVREAAFMQKADGGVPFSQSATALDQGAVENYCIRAGQQLRGKIHQMHTVSFGALFARRHRIIAWLLRMGCSSGLRPTIQMSLLTWLLQDLGDGKEECRVAVKKWTAAMQLTHTFEIVRHGKKKQQLRADIAGLQLNRLVNEP
jgi:hypothetical protein